HVPFSFYVPNMMMKFWQPEPVPSYLTRVRHDYQEALEAAERAVSGSRPEGSWFPSFWLGRLEFALGYADAVEALYRGATAEAAGDRVGALKYAQEALEKTKVAIESYARIARNRTDLGAIAVMNGYGYRAL